MVPETRARVALQARAKKMTQTEIALEFGVSQSQVSDYLACRNRPNAVTQARGARSRKLRIPVSWWLTPEEGGPPIPIEAVAENASPPVDAQEDRLITGRGGRGERVMGEVGQ